MKDSIAGISAETKQAIFRNGSLTYTKAQLAVLFAWLLWGDVCFVIMETVVPSLMPLKFQSLNASNQSIGLILVTIPMIMNTVLNPVVSFKSDRFRSRFGRRIPFILFTVPFIVVCLAGLAWSDRLGVFFHQATGTLLEGIAPNTVAIWIIAVVMIFFSFFNTIVNAVFWYLFNDVVPEILLARFMSWFRTVSLIASSLYSLFIFPMAATHANEILIGAGLLYFVGFGLMCLNVREGSYPAPAQNLDGRQGLVSSIKTFVKECHSHWHYLYVFLGSMSFAFSATILVFSIFFFQATGLNLDQIGIVTSVASIAIAVWILVSGWLADRFHPIRVVLAGQLMQLLLVLPVSCIWLFWHPESKVAFWAWLGISVVLAAPCRAFVDVSDPPLFMRVFPRERYGQFCSANAMWRSLGYIFGGVLSGWFLDAIKGCPGVTNPYAFIPVWQLVFTIPWFFCTWKLYQSWKHYGGDRSYLAPLPGGIRALAPEMSIQAGEDAIIANSRLIAESTQSGTKRNGA